jgi:nucleoside-diphosphate-sugar epimerase
MENKKRALITGVGGSIGIHILFHIMTNTDWEVVGLDSFQHKGYRDRVTRVLKEHPEFNGTISTIILDPPRAGIAPKTLQKTIELHAPTIVYISCNPSTQARDTELLRNAGYELEKISLVDQFPHTGHIESVVKFKLKSDESRDN